MIKKLLKKTINQSTIIIGLIVLLAISFLFTNSSLADGDKILTISGELTAIDKIYDGTTLVDVDISNLKLEGIENNDDVALESIVAIFNSKDVGDNKEVTIISGELTGNDKDKYKLSYEGAPTTKATITAKQLTVDAPTVASKIYDRTNLATVTPGTLTGVESTDTVDLVVDSATYNEATVADATTVTVKYTLTGTNAGNYLAPADSSVSATITAKQLTVGGSFTVNDKPYDGGVSATINEDNLELVGVINPDTVTLSGVTVEFDNKNTGSGKEVKITDASLSNNDGNNYTLSLAGAPTATGRIYSTGGGGVAAIIASQCANVVYGEWGTCNGQFQFRSIVSQSPAGCTLTAEQQIATQRACSLTSDDLVDEDGSVVDESGSEVPPVVESDSDVDKVMAKEKELVSQVNNALVNRLAGRILLQVEGDGQAWYLDPVSKAKHFMGRPADAFTMMRQFGLGVSEANFKAFEDRGAPDRLAGRILLRVESSGEAYYIDPVDMKMHYLGRPDDAFRIMRELALGISNVNLRQIAVGEVR